MPNIKKYVDVNNIEVDKYVTVRDVDGEFGRQTVMAVEDLQYLPTENAREEEVGFWNPLKTETGVSAFGYHETTVDVLCCSCCGGKVDVSEGYFRYCPHCGARMENRKDGDIR